MHLTTRFLRLTLTSLLTFYTTFSPAKVTSARPIHHYHSIPTNNFFSIIPIGTWSYNTNSLGWYGWQLILLGSLFILIISTYKILRFVLNKFLRWLAIKISYERVEKLANPFCIIVVYIIFQSILPFLNLPSSIIDETLIYGNILLCFFCIFSIYQAIDLISFYIVEKQKVEKKFQFNLMLMPVISVSLKVCVSVLGAIKILQILEFDIKGLLTGVGIGGLGFALASQDTIKNFFGSVVILTDKPFNIGDYITAERIDGRVEEIGFRSTRVRTPQGYVTYIPNGKLADTYITNYGEKQYKGLDTILAISSTTPIAAIRIFIEGLRKIIERCPIARAGKYAVYLYELRDSILYIQLKVDFNITEEKIELINRQEILIHIIRLARTLGIRFAFPSHTVQLENYEHQETEEPNAETDQNRLKKKLQDFLNQPVD